ncbi:hydrolase [Escherichia coli]|nr:hydrolase [Escherichia coli]
MTALALFDLLKPNYALATQVEFTDRKLLLSTSRILRQMVTARCGVIW